MQTNTIAKKLSGRRPVTLDYVGNSFRALFINHSSGDAFYPEVTPETVIREVTEFSNKRMIDRDLAGQEASEKRAVGEDSHVAVFQSDNGGRRLGLERREFSYDIHLPERRSDTIRRSRIDRRNGLFTRMNSRKWRDTERRAAFL
ncbi:MAG: hypothetical protein JW896_02515 [Deltaproteobacteria bacterium]|nr:hypothetical protein [Deltaproteobacteria bacterium]